MLHLPATPIALLLFVLAACTEPPAHPITDASIDQGLLDGSTDSGADAPTDSEPDVSIDSDGIDPTIEREGPLKGLPSEEGPHLAKIRALEDNSWLALGRPAPDPQWGIGLGRSWSSKMVYAPDMRGAFINGEGRHGATTERNGKIHYNDDLFFYDINQHRWVCVYPGMELGTYEGRVNEDGFEVDENDHPLPIAYMVHAYGAVAYNTDTLVYAHMWNPSGGGYWQSSMPERVAFIQNNNDKLNGLGGRLGDGTVMSEIDQASPWMYDTLAGHWTRYKTEMQSPSLGHGAHLFYLPTLEQYFLQFEDTHFYDPTVNHWIKAEPSGPRPPQPIDSASCYDSKRNRIYIAMGSYPNIASKELPNRVWAYDVAQNTYLDIEAQGSLPPRPLATSGTASSQMTYDSKNDVVLYFAYGADLNESGATKGIYAYDAESNEWTIATKTYPESWGAEWRRTAHLFYDPVLNAHFLYNAVDSGDGVMFVYRYRQ